MNTTPEQARRTLEAFVAEERPGVRVKAVLEDRTDYLAQTESDGPWRAGESFLFVSKKTGKIWHGAPVDVIDRMDDMKPVKG